MDKYFFVELTNDLYRLTILFPKEEPIRIKIRSLADDILTDLITILEGNSAEKREIAKKLERNLGILESMLEIAEGQNWVKQEDFSEVKEKYLSIKKEIENFNKMQESKQKSSAPLKKERETSGKKIWNLNDRQKIILSILEKRGKAQIQDIVKELEKNVTKRTLRRDFTKLMDLDLVEKRGKTNMTFYRIKDN